MKVSLSPNCPKLFDNVGILNSQKCAILDCQKWFKRFFS